MYPWCVVTVERGVADESEVAVSRGVPGPLQEVWCIVTTPGDGVEVSASGGVS